MIGATGSPRFCRKAERWQWDPSLNCRTARRRGIAWQTRAEKSFWTNSPRLCIALLRDPPRLLTSISNPILISTIVKGFFSAYLISNSLTPDSYYLFCFKGEALDTKKFWKICVPRFWIAKLMGYRGVILYAWIMSLVFHGLQDFPFFKEKWIRNVNEISIEKHIKDAVEKKEKTVNRIYLFSWKKAE